MSDRDTTKLTLEDKMAIEKLRKMARAFDLVADRIEDNGWHLRCDTIIGSAEMSQDVIKHTSFDEQFSPKVDAVTIVVNGIQEWECK